MKEFTKEEIIDGMLEVSNRLADPDLFHQGGYTNTDRTKRCVLGHIENVFNLDSQTHEGIALATTYGLTAKAVAIYKLEDSLNVLPLQPLAWVNDNEGREAIKEVVDEFICDLKDGK